MPLILPARTLSSGDFITNSLRISSSDDGFLIRTTSGVADSNRKTFTFSWWAKLTIGVEQHLYGFRVNAENSSFFRLNDDGQIRFANEDVGGVVHRVQTNRKLRDPSAWFHIVLRVDTTQSTAANRVRIYVNGVEETSLANTDYPAQNYDIEINQADVFTIGAHRNNDGSTTGQVDGYLSEVHFADGQSLAPTVFGETNDNGVWIPKDCKDDITYGTRGFYMQFKETGTSANSSGIGADTSGNDNHFTPTNLVALDVTTDTPMNNFCTLNPLDVYASRTGALSEGNCKLTVNASQLHTAVGTIAPTSGKWYWEIELDSTDGSNPSGLGITNLDEDDKSNMPSKKTWGYGYMASTGNKQNNGNNSSYGNTYTSGDILGVAMDLDNGAVYFSKNGTFQASGDPTSGASKTNAAFTFTTGGSYAPWVADNTSGVGFTWLTNFGNPPFSISSGNADANGYGNFEYAVPTGFFALCTKNLAEYG